MTEIVQHTTSLADQIEFARMVTQTDPDNRARQLGQSILPDSYKGNPANVLVAVGLGASMGLSPAESLYRISVIKGKPSASAELIAANVRKAGHKLRVKVTEDPPAAVCTIIRADDPDEPITISRDMAWAHRMGLANEPNYKKQPSTMLSYRAITACARLACPEALYGVSYTPDEARDIAHDEGATPAPVPTAADFQSTVVATSTDRQGRYLGPIAHDEAPLANVQDAEVVDEGTGQVELISDGQRRAMFAAFTDAGFTTDARSDEGRTARLEYISRIVGRPVESSSDLTQGEASQVLDALNEDATEAGEPA